MRALFLAFAISTTSFLAEWWLDMTISHHTYQLYRDIMIGLMVVHFWDLYAARAERIMWQGAKEVLDEAYGNRR